MITEKEYAALLKIRSLSGACSKMMPYNRADSKLTKELLALIENSFTDPDSSEQFKLEILLSIISGTRDGALNLNNLIVCAPNQEGE